MVGHSEIDFTAPFDFPPPRPVDFSLYYFPFFEMSFGLRVFALWQRQGSGCNSRAAAQL
jgi:hypothetical protein